MAPIRHVPKAPEPLPPTDTAAREHLAQLLDVWAKNASPETEATNAFLQGRFSFLNKTVQSRTPPWQGLDVSKLWAYHLHYFDYARDLALLHGTDKAPLLGGAGGGLNLIRIPKPSPNLSREGSIKVLASPTTPHRECSPKIKGWLLDWIEKNPPGTPLAWDAFPLSQRLINWSLLIARYGWDDTPIRTSMHLQVDYLAQRLERDLDGNHLLKNVAALTVSGTLLGSPHGKRGLALLQRECAAQLLSDGGHIERSSLYHGQVVLDLIIVAAPLESIPDWLSKAIHNAMDFLAGVMHGDGCCAQFNDGAAEEGVAPQTILALGNLVCPPDADEKTGSRPFPDSGIYRLESPNGGGTMIMKPKKAMADYQPGHAHSDLLSFEYSIGKQRIFVNSGTHGYAESPYRDYCRRTRAHNTVCINDQDQHEHWSSFRVARRVHGTVLAWDEAKPALRAAYTSLQGARHERQITWESQGFWLILDRVTARGAFSLDSILHLHPDATLEAMDGISEQHVFRIAAPDTSLLLIVLNADSVQTHRGDKCGAGLYFPRFGKSIPTTTVVASSEGMESRDMGFAMVPNVNESDAGHLLDTVSTTWEQRT
ncbi:MAG: heparinase II/III family protein [Candidatus Hydrogenedentes bacterium]|nr:heparinase II/III family protein [Candidatus Hydrogenedentota bacterium]